MTLVFSCSAAQPWSLYEKAFVCFSILWSLQVPVRIIQQLRDQLQAALDDANQAPYKELGDADPETVAVWLLEDTVVQLLPSILKSVFRSVNDDFVAQHSESGTTATVVVVCGREVVSANVGDSLAYLDTGTQVLLLSGNHRIDENEAERKRLVEAGGDICQAEFEGEAVGPLRIWPGGLAFSRCVSPTGSLLCCGKFHSGHDANMLDYLCRHEHHPRMQTEFSI
jgi:hypothetical protein